jgi:hypothetical protein
MARQQKKKNSTAQQLPRVTVADALRLIAERKAEPYVLEGIRQLLDMNTAGAIVLSQVVLNMTLSAEGRRLMGFPRATRNQSLRYNASHYALVYSFSPDNPIAKPVCEIGWRFAHDEIAQADARKELAELIGGNIKTLNRMLADFRRKYSPPQSD